VLKSTTETQVRLVLERQCRDLAKMLSSKVPAGVGFILFLSDLGADGNLAYMSTIERDSAHRLMHEWLDHEDANHPAEGWETAALYMVEVANAIGFEGELDPAEVLNRCRELRAKEIK
jgi:hypothetical protein